MNYLVYIVRCSDNSLYTGITKDLERRIWQHNNSSLGAKYLRGKRPIILVYSEKSQNRSNALKRELEIKAWDRETKLKFIEKHKRE